MAIDGVLSLFCVQNNRLQNPPFNSVSLTRSTDLNRSEQHGSFTNITILDSMKHFLGFTGLLKCTIELVNKSVLTILIAERSKITESRANMLVTCIVCTATGTLRNKRFNEQHNSCARRYKFLYISLPFSANNNVKSPGFAYFGERAP